MRFTGVQVYTWDRSWISVPTLSSNSPVYRQLEAAVLSAPFMTVQGVVYRVLYR